MLKYDAVIFWGVIIFTKQLDRELVIKFKKVAQRSTSNLSEIVM